MAKVPIGLLTNRDVLRLIYAPAGESTRYIDFRVADMATVGGRPILDALLMLLNAHRFFGVAPELALPALLRDSRKYQADVTVTLGKQVLEALTILLRGFEAAAVRDGGMQLEAALARGDDHVYQGLLTALLRLVFVLYAEDRELLPVEHPLYAQHYSLFALFAELQADLGTLCSNDPICACHDPEDSAVGRYFEGAACHGCLFIAEPSCERFNRNLDRALVVPCIGHEDLAFFKVRP